MKLFDNRIVNPVSQEVTWGEWVKKCLEKNAAEAKPGLGLDEESKEPRGQQRGQVINTEGEEAMTNDPKMPEKEQGGNARPDTGGTTDQKDHKQTDKGGSTEIEDKEPKEAASGKIMGECDDAGKVTEDHAEAGPGDEENPEPKVLINNDPNYQKGESTDPGKVKGDSKKQPGEPVVGKNSSSSNKFKKVASLDHKEKLTLFATLSANKSNPITYVEAMVGLKYANLTEEEKTWLKDFWKVLYPPEYVEEMVADR